MTASANTSVGKYDYYLEKKNRRLRQAVSGGHER